MGVLSGLKKVGTVVGTAALRSNPATSTALGIYQGLTAGQPVGTAGTGSAQSASYGPRAPGGMAGVRRRGRPNTVTGMIAMPARLPNKRQWKKIHSRLHDWRAISIQIINRTGGMNKKRRFGGGGGYRRRGKR